MTDWRIRLSRAEDAAGFHRVEEDAASLLREEPSLAGIDLPPSGTAADHVRIIAKGRSLTATVADAVVGFAAAEPQGRWLHLHELSVARAHQRRGIGAALLEALAIDARNSGYRGLTLTTFREVPWNAPFYARHGFVEVSDFADHPRLAQSLDDAAALGLPRERRVAMIRPFDQDRGNP